MKEIEEVTQTEEVKQIDNGGYEESTTDFLQRIKEIPNILLSEFDKVRLLKIMNQNPNGVHPLRDFGAVGKFKSVFRAMRRGHISVDGTLFPNRPFNNRKNRKLENKKKSIYNEYKRILAIQG